MFDLTIKLGWREENLLKEVPEKDAEFFNQFRGVWISDETRLSSVSLYISNESVFKEKIGFKFDEILC